jgi:hypothetical protein
MRSFLIYVLTLGWLWRWAEQLAEWRLARTLEKYGDESLAARRATNAFSKARFAKRFGRPAPGPVRDYLSALERKGVPLSDLRILLANRLFVAHDGQAMLRSDLNLKADYWIGRTMPVFGIALQLAMLFCIYRHCGTIPWLPAIIAGLGMLLGYYFLGLFTVQPYAILRRHRILIAI